MSGYRHLFSCSAFFVDTTLRDGARAVFHPITTTAPSGRVQSSDTNPTDSPGWTQGLIPGEKHILRWSHYLHLTCLSGSGPVGGSNHHNNCGTRVSPAPLVSRRRHSQRAVVPFSAYVHLVDIFSNHTTVVSKSKHTITAPCDHVTSRIVDYAADGLTKNISPNVFWKEALSAASHE